LRTSHLAKLARAKTATDRIDCLTYTVQSNHMHLALRSRPDVVAGWSDEEVAQRWLRWFPKRMLESAVVVEREVAG